MLEAYKRRPMHGCIMVVMVPTRTRAQRIAVALEGMILGTMALILQWRWCDSSWGNGFVRYPVGGKEEEEGALLLWLFLLWCELYHSAAFFEFFVFCLDEKNVL